MLDFPAGRAHATYETLDTQEIRAGIISGERGEKSTVTAAEINLDRCAPSVDFLEIERGKTIRRDEFCLACYTG